MNGEIGYVIEIADDFIGVQFKKDKTTRCPYFGTERLKKIKAVRNVIGAEFNPYYFDETSKSIPKTDDSIKKELDILKAKISKVKSFNYTDADVDTFFEVALDYPFAVFGYKGEGEFLHLRNLTLAYCMTVRKAQGNQFKICTFLIHGKIPYFINRRVVYVGNSRAQYHLTVVSDSQELINSAILNGDIYTCENLANSIINELPDSMKPVKSAEQVEDEDDDFTGYDDIDDDFDNINLDDIY